MNSIKADILVIGAGPAGLAAARAAARSGDRKIIILDNNPSPGGQIWRAERAGKESKAKPFTDALSSAGIEIKTGWQVFAAPDDRTLLASGPDGLLSLDYEKLILATGARERFLPFPGWTLPNVFGAGGLQALVKGGLSVKEKRVVVAGTGPLLLAVADYLKRKGAVVPAIVEQAPAAEVNNFATRLPRSPSKLLQAIALRLKLLGTPYWTDSWVASAAGGERLQSVEVIRKGRRVNIECDLLACGFDLVPNSELAELLGCRIENGFVAVDEHRRTSREHIYCAGEPTGIGGVEMALLEGEIAGLSAAGNDDAAAGLFRRRERLNGFAEALNRTFELREELKHLSDSSTIVCRCEDVAYGSLTHFRDSRDAKLQTRCGMGPCQGRVCGPATEFLFGWNAGSVRAPIFPVKMEHL